MKILVILLPLAVLSGAALAHDFYDPECCSDQHCRPIDTSRVRVVNGGYLVDDKHFVPERKARFAPDGRYHACWYPSPTELYCFYRPNQGS